MTRNPFRNGNAPFLPKSGAYLLALLAAGALTLHGQEHKDKDKDRERDKKPERSGQPAPTPAPRPAPEARREAPEPRREARPEVQREAVETRREARVEQRRDSVPSPRQKAPPRREPAPTPRFTPQPDPSRAPRSESAPAPRPAPLADPSRSPRHEVSPTPEADPSRSPFPAQRRESPPRRDLSPVPRTTPEPDPSRNPSLTPRGIPSPDRRLGNSGATHLVPGRDIVRPPHGGEIHRATGGAIREVHTPSGAVIRHSPAGVRHVEVTRSGGRVIVANATGRMGYVQRPLVVRNQTFVQRTYVFNGVPQARIYRPWSHGGVTFNLFTPTHYYRPAFYAWGHRSWSRPVHYRWGWETRPWYGYYGGYFAPYPTYSSPAFWLADFLLATTLEAAYLSQNATYSTPPVNYTSATALTPEVKQAIAEEVRRQLEREKEEQASYQNSGQFSSQPAIFSANGPKVFLVSNTLFAYSGDRECPLVEGDVLQLLDTPYPEDETADLRVLSSRGGSCPKGSIVSVRLTELQEMQNHLRATLNQGLSTLQAGEGKNGLPSLSPEERGLVNTSFANEVRPDSNAYEEVTQAAREANRAEQDMINQGGQNQGNPGGTPTITLGMTLKEVENALGKPDSTVDLGSKKIYVYRSLKVTFLKGRVSDVQ